ncbi:MAG: HlyD family secretion protein [Victivallaceae bacterium]|nr:HlyD family secretion protein [Victivallaceae bacterium]
MKLKTRCIVFSVVVIAVAVAAVSAWMLASRRDTVAVVQLPAVAPCPETAAVPPPRAARTVIGAGTVRGSAVIALKNKYAGFIKKVYYYTGQTVKQGDVILEYDDLDWRLKSTQAANAVIEQQKVVEAKELALQLKQLNPLPSEYRNTTWKQMAAKEKLDRLKHELEVYRKLHGNQIVSDFTLREKTQDYKDAEAEVESFSHDISIINHGLGALYVAIAEKELDDARTKLANLEKVRALIEEDGNHYRIVSPRNGIVVNNAETVNSYTGAAATVAEVHSFNNGYYVHCFFSESDIGFVTVGKTYRFRTTLFDCGRKGFPMVKPFRVSRSNTTAGGKTLYLVECQLVSTPAPLPIKSTGQMEIDIP